MGATTLERFGAPHFVFNNAGVAHGVHVFTTMMLDAAKKDPEYQGHIVNTASMAGLLNAPNMGVYNVTKHAVVSLSETLYQAWLW
jgi:NAD(P)-dependent dehydrogenase (short-subunit alcohol dehydrogenase family)